MLNRKRLRGVSRRGGHYRENGLTAVDVKAHMEGTALMALYTMRPHAIGTAARGILWNTAVKRHWVRAMLEEQIAGKRVRRILSGIFRSDNLRSILDLEKIRGE